MWYRLNPACADIHFHVCLHAVVLEDGPVHLLAHCRLWMLCPLSDLEENTWARSKGMAWLFSFEEGYSQAVPGAR